MSRVSRAGLCTDTDQTLSAESLFTVPWPRGFPFQRDSVATDAQRAWEVREILKAVLAKVEAVTSPKFAARLLQARYNVTNVTGSYTGGDRCLLDPKAAALLDQAAASPSSKAEQGAGEATAVAAWWGAVDNFAADVLAILSDFPQNTAAVWFGNWVEAVIAQHLGLHSVVQMLSAVAVR